MSPRHYKEAARYLKVTEGTLRNWVSKGRLKPHKVGKHVLFFKEELETWITNPTVGALEKAPLKPDPPKPAPLTEWAPQCKISIADQDKDPYALLQNLPGPNVKMTPDNMRELARYLVDAAAMCEQRQYHGLKNFSIFRENERFKSSVVLVPFNQMRDLHTLALAAKRAGDVLATTKEKYVVQFIKEGLQRQLPLINMQLKKQGMRSIRFKSLKK